MSKKPKIMEFRFMEYGKPPPEESRFKGILDTEALLGYVDYTERDEANEHKNDINLHDGGYLGYTQKTESTFGSFGWLDETKDKQFKSDLKEAFKSPGDLWWECVFSIDSFEEAKKYNLNNVNDYKEYITSIMPQVFKNMKLNPDDMMWWANYHVDTDHPHVHINFIQKNKNNKRKKGKLTKRELKKNKIEFIKKLGVLKNLGNELDSVDILKNKDILFKELVEAVDNNVLSKDIKSIKDLYNLLPGTGRLQYNSVHMKPYRKHLDKIVDTILKDKNISKQLDDYLGILDILNQNVNKHFDTEDTKSDVATLKETELNKLRIRIANMILQNYKKKDEYQVNRRKTTYSKHNENVLDQVFNREGKFSLTSNNNLIPSIRKPYKTRYTFKKAKIDTSLMLYESIQAVRKELNEWERNNQIG